ncbi:nucleoside recognition domain-containing protein [uncultured Ruminococcus sp.]|uniref:nucleoside recognition domain-containing protein n=1 Tax=uncultured Ruminococcus sp. TaxID=165186 RepID=UPI000EC0B7A6|nr:nucleoside recognition domain-containing protein [uncultured Ruminococcus sp.]HCJ41603.1 spore maturation protein A [Ruminococcus sp.]
MLSAILVIMLILSCLAGCINDTWEGISASAINSCTESVRLGIVLAGTMALWSGLMRVAESSGLTRKLSAVLSPIIRLLFGRLDSCSRKAVSLNLTANLLGLGNAATPTGIAAVKALEKSLRPKRNTALLTVLNTASIQLIPVTIAALRAENGSASPFEIMPAVLVTSLASAAVGCITAAVLFAGGDKNACN